MPEMKFSSSGGELFQVDTEIAKCWPMIRTMVEDLGIDEEVKETVPLTYVHSDVLEKVVVWSTYHKDDPPTPEEDDKISSWDADFLKKLDECTLFGLIRAANFLQIKELLRVTCQTVANMMKGKTPEEIREIFNIENEFTAKEGDENDLTSEEEDLTSEEEDLTSEEEDKYDFSGYEEYKKNYTASEEYQSYYTAEGLEKLRRCIG